MERGVVEITLPSLKIGDRYGEQYIQNNQEKLNVDFCNILCGNPGVLSYAEQYNIVENLCFLHQDATLRHKQENLVEKYLCDQVFELDQLTEVEFLSHLCAFWFNFKNKVSLINNIYLPLKTATTKDQRIRYDFNQMAFKSFNIYVLQDIRLHSKLSYIFEMIDQHRNETQIDVQLLEDIVAMLTTMGLYESYFEVKYFVCLHNYYRQERDILLNGPIMDYFMKLQERLTQENNMVANIFKNQSGDKVLAAMKVIFVDEVLPVLIKQLADWDIFNAGTIEDIAVVYEQLKYHPKANEDLCKVFSKFIVTKGRNILFDAKNENNMIATLLTFKERVDGIVETSLAHSYMYVDAVRIAFKKFINQRKYKPAQLLAKFIDGKMRDKLIPEHLFGRIIVLFRYIQAKDIFEAYYKRYLAKRLLLGKSSSQDAEKTMISKLKFECGDGFTLKLEGMFRDIDLSDGLIQAFKQRGCRSNDTIDFSAQILTCSFWPTFSKFQMSLPESMQYYHNIYQEFYKGRYSGRSLEWTGSLDTCLLKANFIAGAKLLQVSLFQAGVLLLFNDSPYIGYNDIADSLNMENFELRRTLSSLVTGRVKILKLLRASIPGEETDDNIQETEGTSQTGSVEVLCDFKDDDIFEINDELQHKQFRIKLNQLQYKDTEEEQKITEDEVFLDRNLQIDAAVVRLMKQHRELQHTDLLTKMFGVLKFPVKPYDIKKRIEILIERDFIRRDANDSFAYSYIA